MGFGASHPSKAIGRSAESDAGSPNDHAPLLISLPVADRVRAHAFYRDGLGLDAIGELADDGVPEPLMFVQNPMSRLMLVPSDGFGWIIGDHHAAPARDERMCSRHRERLPTTASRRSSSVHAGPERRLPRSQRHSHRATQPRSPIPTATSGPSPQPNSPNDLSPAARNAACKEGVL